MEARRVGIGNWRIDEHGGEKLRVFRRRADGLCYYFDQPLDA